MTTFHYRAVKHDGAAATGEMEAQDRDAAIASLRRMGLAPVEIAVRTAATSRPQRSTAKDRAAAIGLIGELSVLLKAGLPLDRALTLAIGNVEHEPSMAPLLEVLRAVREGAPLSRAMAQRPALFSPTAVAMTEAGEANGRLGETLARLAKMLEEAADLRRLISTSMIYPIVLLAISLGVIAMMLLFVVPQFETLFATSRASLPAASMAVMTASRVLRHDWPWMLLAMVGLGLALRQALRRPATRLLVDRAVLHIPKLGELIRRIETARFSRTLGVLVAGEVPLPAALMLAQRTINNGVIGDAIGAVAIGVREGGGLSAPLAATNVLPRMAIGFFRTGEESSQLALMLERLADVLDKDVKVGLQRMIGVLTPAITVILGAVVAAIIASIMSAILGFNDLAVTQ